MLEDIQYIRLEAENFLLDKVQVSKRYVNVLNGIENVTYSGGVEYKARLAGDRYTDKVNGQVILHTNSYKLQLPFSAVGNVSRLDRVKHTTPSGTTLFVVKDVPTVHDFTGIFVISLEKIE